MELSPLSALKKFWGYDKFRPLQEEIIQSVLNSNDTLALLPTGGGKSICFQVPALCQPGICLVISPLIALMKDQVENLSSKGIKATAVYSGMSRDEVSNALDNCIYGDYKFLYLSPERLLSESARERISRMNVNLLAVDEAHCISQWGYDFRPPYLQIADIRELHPEVPILALTATATPEVREDIMDQLKFKSRNLFVKSFERKNLSYLVYHAEDKQSRMVEILSKVKGSAIVYVRNRKRTKEYAGILAKNKISADFYHAGLTAQLRNIRQDEWKKGTTRVMVCTNAFGMGIDKPDVRTVIHMDLPDNLESYYQEAGRAGRDEQNAYAIALYNKSDISDLQKRQVTSFPPVKDIRKTYQALANFLQVPVDSGMGVSYDFDIAKFISTYELNPVTAVSCLKVIESEGLIAFSDAVFMPSRIHFRINPNDLYEFQVANEKYDALIKTILRSSGGVFDEFVRINESELADRLSVTFKDVCRMLDYMKKNGIIHYEPRKDSPQLTFTIPREEAQYISIDTKRYNDRRKRFIEKSDAVISYVQSAHQCRGIMLLNYFGERTYTRCGSCDYCRELNKLNLNQVEIDNFRDRIFQILESGPATVNDLIENSGVTDPDKGLELITWLVDQKIIVYDKSGLLIKKSSGNSINRK